VKSGTNSRSLYLQGANHLPERVPALQILVAWAHVLSRLDGLESGIGVIGPFLRRHFTADGLVVWLQEHGTWRLSVASPSALHTMVPVVTSAPESIQFSAAEKAPALPLPYQARFDLMIATEASEPLGWISLLRRHANSFTSDEKQLLQEMMDIFSAHLLALMRIKQAQALALTDALTEIWNRRYFEQRYADELKRAQRYRRALAVLMLDLDDFKSFNDTHGHLAGDQALQIVAFVLKTNLRQSDVLCRYGGEEFVVLLPESDLDHALLVAEKLRLAIWAEPFPAGDSTRVGRISISIGVAAFPESGDDEQTVLQWADKALYAAKKSGRNRTCCASHVNAPEQCKNLTDDQENGADE